MDKGIDNSRPLTEAEIQERLKQAGAFGSWHITKKTTAQKAYAAERLDPRWQRKRLEIMQRDGFKCRSCGGTDNTLHIHHSYYVKGRKCWQYPDFSLSTECDSCHKSKHELQEDEEEAEISELEFSIDSICGGTPDDAGVFLEIAHQLSKAKTNIRGLLDLVTEHRRKCDEAVH